MDLRQIAKGLDEVSIRGRERKLTLEDMRGGTITLSNPGVFGAVIATPDYLPAAECHFVDGADRQDAGGAGG